MKEFLERYHIQRDIRLNDVTWKEFFGVVVSRFHSARLHYYLADFMVACSVQYKESSRSETFITDLLKLDVEKLLSGEADWEDGRWLFSFISSLHLTGASLKLEPLSNCGIPNNSAHNRNFLQQSLS